MVRYNVGDRILIKSEPAVREVRNRKSEYSICYSDTHDAVVILDKLEASVLVTAFDITFAIDRNDIIEYLERFIMTLETHITIAYSIGLISTAFAYILGFSCGIKENCKQIDQMNNKLHAILEMISDHTNTSHKEDNDCNDGQ